MAARCRWSSDAAADASPMNRMRMQQFVYKKEEQKKKKKKIKKEERISTEVNTDWSPAGAGIWRFIRFKNWLDLTWTQGDDHDDHDDDRINNTKTQVSHVSLYCTLSSSSICTFLAFYNKTSSSTIGTSKYWSIISSAAVVVLKWDNYRRLPNCCCWTSTIVRL